MSRVFHILLVLMLAISATAQQPASQIRPRYYEGKLYVKLNATSLLDPLTPTIQPGIEYRFSEKLSGELLIGIPVKLWPRNMITDSTYYNYYKIKTELRFYPANRFFYVGPGIFLTQINYSDYNDGFRDNDGYYAYDFAKLDKTIIGASIKAGRVVPMSEVFNLDIFAGIGSRFVHLDAKPQGLVKSATEPGWMWHGPERLGWKTTVHLEFGIKFSREIR